MSNDKKVAVVITVDNHKHAGQPVAKGARIETDEATAKWLVDHKKGAITSTADASKKETK